MEQHLVLSIPLDELEKLQKKWIKEVLQEYIIEIKNQSEQIDKMFTRKETAEFLKVSLPTLHIWSKTGKLKFYRIGNRVLYKKNEIMNALKQS